MASLGGCLRQRGFAVIGLLTPETADLMSLDTLGNIFVINQKDIQYLDNITAFITLDYGWSATYPLKSRVLAAIHACSAAFSPNTIPQLAYTTRLFDGFLVGYKFMHKAADISRVWNNFPKPEHISGRGIDKPFYFMGYGYPKLCLIHNQYTCLSSSVKKDCICYAPILIDYLRKEGGGQTNRIKNYGLKLLRSLFANFPEYNIIFRPAPKDQDHPDVCDIIDYFANEPRFIFDTQNSYIKTFVRSRVMITDFSHIGANFNIIAKLPTIYFKPWKNKKLFDTYNGNYTTYSFTQLISCVQQALQAKNISKDKIMGGLLPFDNSLDELGDDFQDFIDGGQNHDNWLAIARDNPASYLLLSRIILPILQTTGNARMGLLKDYSNIFNSKTLAILALQVCKQEYPDGPVEKYLLNLAGLDKAIQTYGDIDLKVLATLYMQSIQNLKQEKTLSSEEKTPEIALLAELAKIAAQGGKL